MHVGTLLDMGGANMWTKAALVAWGLSASLVSSSGARRLSVRVLEGMADAALANPVVDGEDGPRVTMGYEVAIAWFESGNNGRAVGDGNSSYCWGQIYLPNGKHTMEGYSGNDLLEDTAKCARVVVRLVKQSLAASPAENPCELCLYARGRFTDEARRISEHRVSLVKKLLATVDVNP